VVSEQQINDENTAISKIRSAGVVGAGGAGFPTHVKLSASAEYLLINGAECEPLLQVDQQLLPLEAKRFLNTLEVLMEMTKVKKTVVAMKKKYKEAWEVLGQLNNNPRIELFELGDFYPAGDEHVTVYEALGRVVPQGGIPIKVGTIVQNPETILNIADALEDKPVIDKYITVTGLVQNPATVKVPIGMPLIDVIMLCHNSSLEGNVVIEGGPMMGKIVEDLNNPVTKTTKGLIVLPADHLLIRRKTLPLERQSRKARSLCMQCQRCTEACPRYLLGHEIQPHRVMRSIAYSDKNPEGLKIALYCSECGACEVACPMDLSPKQVNSYLRAKFAKAGIRPEVKEGKASPIREMRKITVSQLVPRLGLTKYKKYAPMKEMNFECKMVKLALKQHVGAPASPVVTVGQKVQRGDLIAEIPKDALGARVHASISGKVTEVTDYITIMSD